MNRQLIKESTEKFFDSVAERSETFSEAEKGQMFVANRVGECIAKESKILDVGCGEGKTLELILKTGDYGLAGIDISAKAIEKARFRLNASGVGRDCRLVHGDVDDMPYMDREFDLLICSHSFHHYPAPRKSLSEMYRVLKNGGELWIIENDAAFLQRLRYNIYQMIHRHPAGDVKKYSHKELCHLAKEAGFKVVGISKATERGFLMVALK